MKIHFTYDENKDIECLLSKGAGSQNSPNKTKTYEALLAFTSDITNKEKVREFVRKYIQDNNIEMSAVVAQLQGNWDTVAEAYEKRAEEVFDVKIENNITAFVTITGRYPYNIDQNFFYVSTKKNANQIAMHELWHFYTWYKFGGDAKKLGDAKYNDKKEALSVLLNETCADLMAGEIDRGYPQHQELRNIMKEQWQKTHDINIVWQGIV